MPDLSVITPFDLLALALTFLLAGGVKGVIGMGLPTVSLAILTLIHGLPEAMGLLLVPSFVTNLWQALAGGQLEAEQGGKGEERRCEGPDHGRCRVMGGSWSPAPARRRFVNDGPGTGCPGSTRAVTGAQGSVTQPPSRSHLRKAAAGTPWDRRFSRWTAQASGSSTTTRWTRSVKSSAPSSKPTRIT